MQSHPEWVRGLKQGVMDASDPYDMSHPEWVRGLKHDEIIVEANETQSHPEWVRGLKPKRQIRENRTRWVAPRVGAWIETTIDAC